MNVEQDVDKPVEKAADRINQGWEGRQVIYKNGKCDQEFASIFVPKEQISDPPEKSNWLQNDTGEKPSKRIASLVTDFRLIDALGFDVASKETPPFWSTLLWAECSKTLYEVSRFWITSMGFVPRKFGDKTDNALAFFHIEVRMFKVVW